ncbi:hypothetical protein G6F43_011012 [Rhizopus delemar]|nr:hypothetical protein G6F43_011012 [Rhizopus delemar]
MSIPNKRLQGIKAHISPDEDSQISNVESLRLRRKHDQVPYHSPLDPLRFLLRSSMVFAEKTAVIHRQRSYTYRELSDRVRRLATVLIKAYHVKKGDRVAILCQNIPSNLESMYAIPATGGIMVPVNTRLVAEEIEYILRHSGATLLILQQEFESKMTNAIKSLVKIIYVADSDNPNQDPYEMMLANCKKPKLWDEMPLLNDENAVFSINYTSGSTGRPKGVMASYRGVYLNALGMIIQGALSTNTVYLWTVPMFHCNGWSFPWALVAVGSTQVMLNKIDYSLIWDLLIKHNITHYNGAPTVQNELCNHKKAVRLNHPHLNLQPTQVYGLTETYGPAVLGYDVAILSEYNEEEQQKRLARQGYNTIISDELRVLNKDSGLDVTANGKEIGEVCFTGNLVMLGYYNDPEETEKAFKGGVFWSGDLAVRHPDGTIEILDRSKDIIVSGGENISSIEVENVVVQLEEVMECAIVSEPDDKWGERPVAFVVLKAGKTLTADIIFDHCRKLLAGYKCPEKVIFIKELPKTSTGKT